jgi:hypothetical protein
MTAAATSFAVAVSPGLATTARDRVAEFLAARPRAFCDACAARAVGIDPSTAYRAAVKLARAAGFVRHYGACSECGTSRLVSAYRDVDLAVSGTVVACHDSGDARLRIAPAREEGRVCRQ